MKPICKNQNINKKPSAYIALVNKIYSESNKPQRYKGTMESMLREFFSKTSKYRYTWKRDTFKALLVHLYNQKCYALLRSYAEVEVLHNISAFGNRIYNDIEGWEASNVTKEEQISSLIKYCFAKYETPKFLEYCFYGSQKLYMLWYIQLGKGVSVKDLSQMPIKLTSKMAHEFRNAPDYYSVFKALRYAQAIGCGATKEAAKLIAFSSLSRTRDNEEVFWTTVVQFFSQIERLETNELDQIVDYLAYKYRENNSFSMKGRTFNALLNQTNDWHRTMYINREIENVLSWKSSGIKPLYKAEIIGGQTIVFKTIELCNSIELYDEGKAMQHCVAEYDEDCEIGDSRIFSLQSQAENEAPTRLATIEIALPSFEIVQAKAKYNQEPNKKTMMLIEDWIKSSNIKKVKKVIPNYEPIAHARAVERTEMNNFDFGATLIFRIILLILYLFLMFGRLLTSQPTIKPDIENYPFSIDMKHQLDSIFKEKYGVKPFKVE
ncbi:PcfJ domain-containing protein [Winogradskyella sp.]|uniref:PcfJ domain-containing protein n=1 Tax=Winogradskyella sp. TaxID=1883156 RepID=UPI0025F95468|nr:PcfJ domain-containing protein [Winogradskyella sp.]